MGQAILLLHVRSAERISDDIPASSTDDTPPPVCETAKSSAAQMHGRKAPRTDRGYRIAQRPAVIQLLADRRKDRRAQQQSGKRKRHTGARCKRGLLRRENNSRPAAASKDTRAGAAARSRRRSKSGASAASAQDAFALPAADARHAHPAYQTHPAPTQLPHRRLPVHIHPQRLAQSRQLPRYRPRQGQRPPQLFRAEIPQHPYHACIAAAADISRQHIRVRRREETPPIGAVRAVRARPKADARGYRQTRKTRYESAAGSSLRNSFDIFERTFLTGRIDTRIMIAHDN